MQHELRQNIHHMSRDPRAALEAAPEPLCSRMLIPFLCFIQSLQQKVRFRHASRPRRKDRIRRMYSANLPDPSVTSL